MSSPTSTASENVGKGEASKTRGCFSGLRRCLNKPDQLASPDGESAVYGPNKARPHVIAQVGFNQTPATPKPAPASKQPAGNLADAKRTDAPSRQATLSNQNGLAVAAGEAFTEQNNGTPEPPQNGAVNVALANTPRRHPSWSGSSEVCICMNTYILYKSFYNPIHTSCTNSFI